MTKEDKIKLKYKYSANYGLYLGLFFSILYFAGILTSNIIISNMLNLIWLAATPFITYLLIKRFKDNALNGEISFFSAVSFGSWMFFFAGLIMAVTHYIHYKYIDPAYISKSMEQALTLMKQMNYPKETIDTIVKMGTPRPIRIIVSYIIIYIAGGALLSLIIAPFISTKKKKKIFN